MEQRRRMRRKKRETIRKEPDIGRRSRMTK